MTIKCSLAGATALVLLLTPALAQLPPPVPVPLDQKAADSFAGYYQVNPRGAMRFYREDTRFYFNAVGTTQKAEMVPITTNKFAYQNGAIIITFTPGTDGKVNAATVSIGGRDVAAPRITEDAANALAAAAKVLPPPMARNWALKIAPHRTLTALSPDNLYYLASFTPDGNSVLVSRTSDGGKSFTLYRIPAAGGPEAMVFARDGLPATRANSARDGRIAFNAGNAIWVMDADGGNARALPIKDMITPAYASWYPDGKSIGFGDGVKNTLYRADVATGAVMPVTRQAEVLTGMSRVSPDGKWIVFAGQKNSGQIYNQGDNQIWVVDDKGAARPVEANPGPGRAPSWSPDGMRIAFESGRGSPDGKYAIFVINRDGSGLTQVTDYVLNGMHPHWSPDGNRLVFSIGNQPGQSNGVAVIDVPAG